ncbi:MAG: hypothetical protein JKY49_06205 [Cohaesibacteraceae bacterium]|nr:hypothetical protein [Cohaesibacteraceae bacterium]
MKKIAISFLAASTIVVTSSNSWAAARLGCAEVVGGNNNGVSSNLTLDNYIVNLKDIAYCSNASCSGKSSLISSGGTMDIASGNPAAAIGSFPAAAVEKGEYTHLRITISRTIQLQAIAAFTATGVCVTKAVTGNTGDGAAYFGIAMQADASNPALASLSIPSSAVTGAGGTVDGDDAHFTVALGATQPVKEGYTFPSVDISFGVVNGIGVAVYDNNSCGIVLGAPVIKFGFGGQAAVDMMPATTLNCANGNLPANI